MESGTKNLLERLRAKMRAAGEQVEAPASTEALDTLHDYAMPRFRRATSIFFARWTGSI